MCSIAGSAGGEGVHDMLEAMAHRAPDDTGVIGEMGMGRLAIIDLESDGLCPFEEDGVVLVFNGEIYNYKSLRSEYKLDCTTESDTEVLFRLYRKLGIEKTLDSVNGMFAFAIKDGDKTILARDLAGQKPLYYSQNPFRFASEAKALNFNCKEFPPAHYGIFESGELTIHRWWHFEPKPVQDPEKELERLLEDSVRLRTQSDVPYGIFLSDGVDSTLISTFHDFEHIFTYEDGNYFQEFKKKFPQILYHLDGPVNSFSPFGLWKLSEMAHEAGVKVVLSGEGADELFGGYVRYVADSLMREASREFPSYKNMFRYEENVNQAGWREFHTNLRELLRMGDRMTSAFGVENRCPFLDRRIVELAFSLTPEQKIQGLETKLILRSILKKRKPDYVEKEKHGLYCSVNKWIGVDDRYDKKAYRAKQEYLWQHFLQSSPHITTTNSHLHTYDSPRMYPDFLTRS